MSGTSSTEESEEAISQYLQG